MNIFIKKTVAIITIHVGQNHGSVLQTIATAEVFKKLGMIPLVINYIPYRVTYKAYWAKCRTSFITAIKQFLYFPIKYIGDIRFRKYLTGNCKLSKAFSDNFIDDVNIVYPEADYYITGSDQVWNSVYNQGIDRHYYLDKIPENKKRIAYAASFGREELPENELREVKKLLAPYSAISVREKSAVDIVRAMGLDAIQLIDPTFMLNKSDWERFMSRRIIKESYIMVYLPYNTTNEQEIYESVYRIADEFHLKVVTVSSGKDFIFNKYVQRNIRFSNPGDFLSLMYYSDFIITNSFHGTAFSINFNKKFFVYMPSGYTTRIISILDLVGLKDRVLTKTVTIEQMHQDIDYTGVNQIIETEKNKAIAFLQMTLNE